MVGLQVLALILFLMFVGGGLGYIAFSERAFLITLSFSLIVIPGILAFVWADIYHGDPVMSVLLGLMGGFSFMGPYTVVSILKNGSFLD